METLKFINLSLKDALDIYPDCRDLILCKGSAMSQILDNKFPSLIPQKIKVELCCLEEKVLGWSWLIRCRFRSKYSKEKELKNNAYSLMLFVNPEFRKKGIARQLFLNAQNLARKEHRRLFVHPWDPESENFYKLIKESNKVTYIYLLNPERYKFIF